MPRDDGLHYWFLLSSLTLGVLGMIMRRAAPRRQLLPGWLSALILGLATGGMLTAGFMYTRAHDAAPLDQLAGPGVSPGCFPLKLQASGWLHGAPLTGQTINWPDLRGRVVVLDVWADW